MENINNFFKDLKEKVRGANNKSSLRLIKNYSQKNKDNIVNSGRISREKTLAKKGHNSVIKEIQRKSKKL